MNLKELSQLNVEDLKNIDWSEMFHLVLSRRDYMIALVIIVVALLGNGFMILSKKGNTAKLKEEITALEKKVESSEKLTAAKKKMADFSKNFPEQIPEDRLLKILTDFAIENDVKVVSITPDTKKSQPLYDYNRVRLNLAAGKYSDLWSLIYTIENSPYALRVERWETNQNQRRQVAEAESLMITLVIGSFNLKAEQPASTQQ